jgi:hypothetical protein
VAAELEAVRCIGCAANRHPILKTTMVSERTHTRPEFSVVLEEWKALLRARHLPSDLIWIFDENLVFEPDPGRAGTFRVGFQVLFRPPPQLGPELAYDHFSAAPQRLVFYRLGTSHGKSVCTLLCDDFLEPRGVTEGYERRDHWRISFRPGPSEEVEEITDLERWHNRVTKGRPLHDLDFCMSTRALHEILAHGRVLSAYEHYALHFLHAWARLMGKP